MGRKRSTCQSCQRAHVSDWSRCEGSRVLGVTARLPLPAAAGKARIGASLPHGFSPDVVEKTDSYSGLGYVLGLWPAESNILQGLGTYGRSRSHADPMHMYTLLCDSGRELNSYRSAGYHRER